MYNPCNKINFLELETVVFTPEYTRGYNYFQM